MLEGTPQGTVLGSGDTASSAGLLMCDQRSWLPPPHRARALCLVAPVPSFAPRASWSQVSVLRSRPRGAPSLPAQPRPAALLPNPGSRARAVIGSGRPVLSVSVFVGQESEPGYPVRATCLPQLGPGTLRQRYCVYIQYTHRQKGELSLELVIGIRPNLPVKHLCHPHQYP